MKKTLLLLIIAILKLGSAPTLAAPLDPATANVFPANYFYIAGAPLPSQPFNTVAKLLFDVPADVVRITAANAGTCIGQDANNGVNHVGYLGLKGGVATLIVLRVSNSGQATLQLLATSTAAPASVASGRVITLPGNAITGSSGNYTATSNNCAVKLPNVALLDLRPKEHTPAIYNQAGTGNYASLNSLQPQRSLGMQGYGVAVSASLYAALVNASITGAYPFPLVNGVQPSILSPLLSDMLDSAGSTVSAAGLLNDPTDSNTIEIARATDSTGIQAVSNIRFKPAVPWTANDLPIGDIAINGIAVTESSTSSQIKTRLNGPGYVVGVLPLSESPFGLDTWKFVAYDGVSPNIAWDLSVGGLTTDAFQRQTLAAHFYCFGYESFAYPRSPGDAGITNQLVPLLKSTTYTNVTGFAYTDVPGTWAKWESSLGYIGNKNKQSKWNRGGNNQSGC